MLNRLCEWIGESGLRSIIATWLLIGALMAVIAWIGPRNRQPLTESQEQRLEQTDGHRAGRP